MNMTSLPIKKNIEKLFYQKYSCQPGVWAVKGKNLYLKLASELWWPQVKIPLKNRSSSTKALEDALRCAKVYQTFVKEGVYHPKTGIAVCKDQRNLTLMIIMPKLAEVKEGTKRWQNLYGAKEKKLKGLESKFNLKGLLYKSDLGRPANWGFDKKAYEFYAFDLHTGVDYKEIIFIPAHKGYKKILHLAKQMGIK